MRIVDFHYNHHGFAVLEFDEPIYDKPISFPKEVYFVDENKITYEPISQFKIESKNRQFQLKYKIPTFLKEVFKKGSDFNNGRVFELGEYKPQIYQEQLQKWQPLSDLLKRLNQLNIPTPPQQPIPEYTVEIKKFLSDSEYEDLYNYHEELSTQLNLITPEPVSEYPVEIQKTYAKWTKEYMNRVANFSGNIFYTSPTPPVDPAVAVETVEPPY